MGTAPTTKIDALTVERLIKILDPHRVYYRVVINDTFAHGTLAEIKALAASAKELKAQYGDFDGLIKAADAAATKAKGR